MNTIYLKVIVAIAFEITCIGIALFAITNQLANGFSWNYTYIVIAAIIGCFISGSFGLYNISLKDEETGSSKP